MEMEKLIVDLEESVELIGAGANVGGFPCSVVHVIVGIYIMSKS